MADARRLLDTAMSERELLRHCVIPLARVHGWLAFHDPDSRRSEPGLPDLVLARRGVVLLIETKTEKGRVSTVQRISRTGRIMPSQEDWIRESGAKLWRPSDWSSGEIERILK